MATNPTGDAQRIILQCFCGKRLSTSPKHAGKHLKCPACGKAVMVPGSASSLPAPVAAAQIEIESEGIPVGCIGCNSKLRVPGRAAGRKIKCPKCGKVLLVPEAIVSTEESELYAFLSPPAIPTSQPAATDNASQPDAPKIEPTAKSSYKQSAIEFLNGNFGKSLVILLATIAIGGYIISFDFDAPVQFSEPSRSSRSSRSSDPFDNLDRVLQQAERDNVDPMRAIRLEELRGR